MLEQQLDSMALAFLRRERHSLDQPAPGFDVRSLEGVVVAFAARPDDQMGAERTGERGRLCHDPLGLGSQLRIGVDETTAPEAGIEVQAAGDAVDVVAVERRLHCVEVVGREFVGVMELVTVDQLAETLDGTMDLVGDRLVDVVVRGLIAAGDEPGDHRSERPDADACLQHCARER